MLVVIVINFRVAGWQRP